MLPRAFPWLAVAIATGFCAQSSTAHADAVDKIGKKIIKLEAETSNLSQGIRKPNIKTGASDKASRRLVDAQVLFGIGNYDDAALMLYDFVAKYPKHLAYDRALYYLAESLFLKGDFYAARTYFKTLVLDVGTGSKFYQQALERLVELSLKLRDDADVQDWLDALDAVPAGKQRASVPYVRGKHAYFSNDYDAAIVFFAKIKRKSRYYHQARYLLAGTHVAKGDLVDALRVYAKLMRTKPKNKDDKLVLELTHLAMGRVFYECNTPEECNVKLSATDKENVRKNYERAKLTAEQLEEQFTKLRKKKLWSKAIDHYLMISRRSELFDEALFEIAWVYVKNKKFDKALRSLELLALADPEASRLPEVRILEGNLRIRRAQALQFSNKGNSAEEYAKARKVFDETKGTFDPAHKELKRINALSTDPRAYMAQITGRVSETFDVASTMPEVAAEWVRKQPGVDRVVNIEQDLGQIRDEIAEAERTIRRLEQALDSHNKVNVFPALAEKKTRAVEILEELFNMRIQLMNHERALVTKHASGAQRAKLDRLRELRQRAARALSDLPNSEVKHGERIRRSRNEYTDLDKRANEVALVIEQTQATLIAIRKYIDDRIKQGAHMGDLELLTKTVTELRIEIKEMRTELTAIRRETALAKDTAGVGDEVAERAVLLRARLRQAIEDEHRYMVRISRSMSGGDRRKVDQISNLASRANSTTLVLDRTNERIEEIVEFVLKDVREALDEEKSLLSAYKREYIEAEAESRTIGGEILEDSFKDVEKAFYDVVVRSDIGIIDITWAQREYADTTLKKLDTDKKRAARTLRVDFAAILKEEAAAKAAAKRNREKKQKLQQKKSNPGANEDVLK